VICLVWVRCLLPLLLASFVHCPASFVPHRDHMLTNVGSLLGAHCKLLLGLGPFLVRGHAHYLGLVLVMG
jgi:hypothetical protein